MPTGTREILEPRVPVSLWGPAEANREAARLALPDLHRSSFLAPVQPFPPLSVHLR
jgi:hypothetical protein